MFLYKRNNGIWYIGKYINGKRVNESTKSRSKSLATVKLADEMNKSKLDLSGEIDLDTFRSKVISDAEASNFSTNSIYSINYAFNQLKTVLGTFNLTNPLISKIKTVHIQELKIIRTKQVSPTTFNIVLRTLKGIFSRAIKWGYLSINPCKGVSDAVEINDDILCMNPAELKLFFDAILNDAHRVIFLTALHTVCRRSELINIQIKDINFNEMKITIRNKPTFRTKTKKNREVPVSNELYIILTEYLAFRYGKGEGNILPMINENDFLFVTPQGNQYTEDALTQLFKRIRNRAGLPDKYHLHCLRHTGISLMLNEMNVPPTIVKDIAGHSRLTTTMKYCHTLFNQKRDAVLNLNYGRFIK